MSLAAIKSYRTLSGLPLDAVYSEPIDAGRPGDFPYTRGIHENMYRGKLWTMRQFAGFATAEDTNARDHYLLAQGQNGLSVSRNSVRRRDRFDDYQLARLYSLGDVSRRRGAAGRELGSRFWHPAKRHP
jgi:methylmalonyl-CoA mutase N-terminal domain/subunit